MGNQAKGGGCAEYTEECENCSGLDAFAPSPIVVQSFGLPANHYFGKDPDYVDGFSKIPVSSARDWNPARGNDYTDEFQGSEEKIQGNPSLQDAPAKKDKKRAMEEASGVSPPSPTRASPAEITAMQNAPMQNVMPEGPKLDPVEPSSPGAAVESQKQWRRDTTLHEVLEDTCWLWYCLFYGCGCHPEPTHPKWTCESCCCRNVLEMIACCSEGCCTCVNHCVCCTCLVEYPPQERTPCCLWAGDPCLDYCPRHKKYPGGKDKTHGEAKEGEHEGTPSKYQGIFTSHDTCFCCCCGCGQCCVPDCELHQAFCCCRCVYANSMPSCANGCWSCLMTCCYCNGQCWLPPQSHFNPCCAVCGLRCRKKVKDIAPQGSFQDAK